MRKHHVFLAPQPSPEELERAMADARRMRSAAMRDLLGRAWAWARAALWPGRAPRDPVSRCC